DPAAGDRGAAGAAIGLEYVAVDVDGALAERLEVDHGAQGAADQPLDLDPPAVGTPALGVTLLALPRRRREHRVLGRDPAAALPLEPARHPLGDRRGADDPRLPLLVERRAIGRA